MQIIAHRGLWNQASEKNSLKAIQSAISQGFGVEIDVRDFNGELVVSHDIPFKNSLLLEDVFRLIENRNSQTWALNIKADGLSLKIKELLEKYSLYNYFTFDMSIPEMVRYKNRSINFFTHKSEVLRTPLFEVNAKGVWLDAFDNFWYDDHIINELLCSEKRVCIVSEDLHGRSNNRQWSLLKKLLPSDNNWLLCTDKPLDARSFFND